jgi:serine/threonine protein kinase
MSEGALSGDARIGTILADRYRIDALIGEGGMGKVYAAEHVLMRKRLAVKVLHRELTSVPEVVARFEREAMAAANIDHPNVAAATDFGKLPDGAVFLVLEYVRGKSLRDEIAKGPFPADRALSIVRQIASGLSSAHALEIVHRDLKPENVMLVDKGGDPDFVKVLDFGIAKVPIPDAPAGPKSSRQPLTKAGMVFGTPEYMAPEQALGHTVDARADLYGLGVILYEMLAGVRPFSSQSQVGILGQQLSKPPPKFAERAPGVAVPPAVEQLAERLLARDVRERFQTAAEVVQAVDQLLAPLPGRGQNRFTLAGGSPNSVRGSQPSYPGLPLATRPSIEVNGPLPAFPIEGTPLPSAIFAAPLAVEDTGSLGEPAQGAHSGPDQPAPPLAAPQPSLPEKRAAPAGLASLAARSAALLGRVRAFGAELPKHVSRVEARAEALRGRLPAKVAAALERVPTRALLAACSLFAAAGLLGAVALVVVATRSGPEPTASASADRAVAPVPSASTAASAPAAVVAPAPPAMPSGVPALEALVAKSPKDSALLVALGRAYADRKEHAKALGSIARALSVDPAVRDQPEVMEVLYQAALAKSSSDASFALLQGPMGARGADVIHRIWSAPDVKPALKQRAEKWLRSRDFERASSPALNVTVALQLAESCKQKYALLLRAKNVGDERTLSEIAKLRVTTGCGKQKTDDCHACLRTDSRLEEAARAIESRRAR